MRQAGHGQGPGWMRSLADYHLERRPPGGDPSLRAWNTADQYLLNHAHEAGLCASASRMLVVNDAFGALAVALSEFCPDWWSDSYRSARAAQHNLEANGLSLQSVAMVGGSDDPRGPYDLVLLRLPKSLAWLEDQLLRLRPQLAPKAVVVAGSMIKHTPKRAYELLEACIGPTSTSLGWKKARLATSRFAPDLACATGVAPKVTRAAGHDISARPNVFAWDRFDPGAQTLLAHLPDYAGSGVVVDQGCGSGVVALAVAQRCPHARIVGVDESYQAVASARFNADHAGLDPGRIRFVVGDDLQEAVEARPDLIVCNPPFHQAHEVGDHVAWGMFRQARRALAPGGRYVVVGNRHMNYHVKLSRLFGRCEVLGSDRRFVVLQARMTA